MLSGAATHSHFCPVTEATRSKICVGVNDSRYRGTPCVRQALNRSVPFSGGLEPDWTRGAVPQLT